MNQICYLCGKEIMGEKPSNDHCVPKQFIKRSQPKVKGSDYIGCLPTHERCNNSFGPEKMCGKALQVLEAYQSQVYTNLNNTDISFQIFKKSELRTFSEADFNFFGLIDTSNIGYENWAHDSNFFKDKKKIVPLEKPMNIALSVLSKSASAVLVKKFNLSPKSCWNLLCIPYKLQESDIDIDNIFRNSLLIEDGVKIWFGKFDNNEDYSVIYKYEKILLIISFSFSKDETLHKEYLNQYRDASKYIFKNDNLMGLVNYNWIKNCLH